MFLDYLSVSYEYTERYFFVKCHTPCFTDDMHDPQLFNKLLGEELDSTSDHFLRLSRLLRGLLRFRLLTPPWKNLGTYPLFHYI